MNQDTTEYSVITSALKRTLRRQGITYRELAETIGMSESGIKKILNAEDGSFQRLAQICQCAGTSISDLLSSNVKSMVDVSFTTKQQEFFLDHPTQFHFFWRLVYERTPLSELTAQWKMDEKLKFKYLRQLDQVGVLKLLPNGRVRLPSIKRIRWVGDGPLIRKLYREWSRRLIGELARPDLDADKLFLIRYLRMTRETYKDLLDAQRALEAEFVRRAILEMQSSVAGLQHVRWVTGIDNQSFVQKTSI